MKRTKVQQQMKVAKKKGLTPLQLAEMKALTEKYAKEAEVRAFLHMLAIPLNILIIDYWPKSARKRIPEFIDKVLSLYESVQLGVVTDEELREVLRDYAGMEVD